MIFNNLFELRQGLKECGGDTEVWAQMHKGYEAIGVRHGDDGTEGSVAGSGVLTWNGLNDVGNDSTMREQRPAIGDCHRRIYVMTNLTYKSPN